ncbi:MAG: acyl-CoA dehydrogenase family protein [Candidatus Krumholzibacteriia bacterium]
MDFQLSEQHRMIRDMARDFARGEIEPVAARLDAEKRFPADILAKAAGLGLMGVMVPPEYGGAGLDMLAYILVLEEVAKACASTCVILSVHNTLANGTLLRYGNAAQKQRWLPDAAAGKTLGAYLLTEPGAGSDAASLQCRAEAVDGGWRMNGSKAFITNGGQADFGILYAVTEPGGGSKGISAFVLDFKLPGVHRGPNEKKMGLNASSTVMVTLEDVVLPADALLGERGEGLKIALGMLDAGRIGIAAQSLGIAAAALEESQRYAGAREQFGSAIGRFQSVQWHLVDMALGVEAARLLTYRAALDYGEGRGVTKEAAMAKLYASQTAVRCAELAVQIHGGYGYLKDFKVERLFRDARVLEIYEGTTEVQRMVIARQLLSA